MREILDSNSENCQEVIEQNEGYNQSLFSASDSQYRLALKDIVGGIKAFRIWMFLAWQDISLRYRRSYLGPFWITINMAITVCTIGFLYGRLFGVDFKQYYPALAAGMLSWNLISSTITDFVNVFSSSKEYIKQIKLPYFIYILRVASRNFIIFLHNIVVFIPIIFIFKVPLTLSTLFLIPSLMAIFLFGIVFGLLLAILGARFRDLAIIIGNIVHVIFFMTPVLWQVSTLPERYQYLIKFNPFAQIIELMRNPMLGKLPSLFAIAEVAGLFILGSFFVFYMFAKKRKQIIYWL